LIDDGLILSDDLLSDLLGSVILHDILDEVLGLVHIDMFSHLGREGGKLEHLIQLVVRLVGRVHHVLANLAEVLIFEAIVERLSREVLLLLRCQFVSNRAVKSSRLVQSHK
jgi:hypothetical protein